jgi:G3E family GTPase
MTRALPFTVIGGYLGAGKTTLMNNLLSQTAGLRAAVLVNDFGEINIDAQLIASHDGDTISLANGCLCCSLTNGFAVAIAEVLRRAEKLDHVIVEASGVAEPGKIAQYGQMYGLPLDGVLVVVDAEQIRTQADNKYVGDTVLRQLAQADMLLLNKTDLVSRKTLAELRLWLSEQASHASICETSFAKVPPQIVLGAADYEILRAPASPRFLTADAAHDLAFKTWTLTRDEPVARTVIERLAKRLGKWAFRAKGFVRLAEAPTHRHLYQQVGRRWTLEDTGPCDASLARTQLVIIGSPAMKLRSPREMTA